MLFPLRSARMLSSLGIALFLILTISTPGLGRDDSRPKERTERRLEREKRFLLRAIEEMDQSLSSVSEIMKGLERQIDGIQLLESARREDDLRAFLDWYYQYAGWLTEYRVQFDADLTAALSGEKNADGWIDRYNAMATDYRTLAGDLLNIERRLEQDATEIDRRIFDLRARLSDLTTNREGDRDRRDRDRKDRDRDKDRRDQNRPDKDEDVRDKERRALEAARLVSEIQAYENLLMYLQVLTELAKYELIWIDSRAADCAALDDVARALGSGGRAVREDVYNRIIRNYESSITSSRRQLSEIDRKLSRITQPGTLQTLSRQEELSDYSIRMKRRYEYHIAWLSQQISAYRAELTGM